MQHYSIRRRIAISYILLILTAMGSLAIYVSSFVKDIYLEQLENQLLANATLISETVTPEFADAMPGKKLNELADYYGNLLNARITFIAPDGTVLGESTYNYQEMENHLYRPEIQQALKNGRGSNVRYSGTAKQEMLYAALRLETEKEVKGIIRIALPIGYIRTNLSHLNAAILVATVVTGLLAVGLAIGIAGYTTRSLRELTQVVQQVAEGDLSARLLPTTQDEIAQLTRAFNTMTEQLQEKMQALSTEQSQLAAILEHMADGVMIINPSGQVERINPAAARILEIGQHEALDHSFAEVARHHQFIELWHDVQRDGEERVATIETAKRQGPFLQVIITPLKEAGQQNILVVLQDLTQIRRLETIRRDFISNISHELRTPLASLQAVAETLQDGAIHDPEAAKRFLGHIEEEVCTMTQLIEELLELSRIESGKVPFHLQPMSVSDFINPPIERLMPQIEHNNLTLSFDIPPNLPQVLADFERLQRVISNLVHNAIKFTPSGGHIIVSAKHQRNQVIIAIHDTGIGIPEDDILRIFERFYKADQARTGEGTGLGLAIAKHIVQAHGGNIWVKSKENDGSTFYFSLQVAKNI